MEDPVLEMTRSSHVPPLLSGAEEIELAKRIERGDLNAKERMIESNLRLVSAVARTYRGSSVPIADLVQEGTIGLIRAVERFDHRRGLKLSSYAVWWIRRAILDAIAGSNVIRMPSKANQQLAAVRRVEEEFERLGLRAASDAAIAERTELGENTVHWLRTAPRVTASLDESIGEEATPLMDLVADERAVDPSESAIARESHEEIATMLRLLPVRHREVLIRRYGLNDGCPRTHGEIGERIGVGEERSRQIEREALHRLRSIATTSSLAA